MGFQHRISGIPMYNWYIKRNHNLVGISWEYDRNMYSLVIVSGLLWYRRQAKNSVPVDDLPTNGGFPLPCLTTKGQIRGKPAKRYESAT